ncbi:amidohydrolase family protein [Pseudonocardia nematodicida]|uniref:imidazolonepropionase n=1 Tax=Pseudonocardia nematodicida TaxID=1206997 RepID=A0ABV1K5M5_9PSEU
MTPSVAQATDCNPGSNYTSSMAFCIALAVPDMGMSPAEALRAASWRGAAALRRTEVGAPAPGRRADLLVFDAPPYIHLADRPGVGLIRSVVRGGRQVVGPRV